MGNNISIIELDYHPEVLKHLIEIIVEIKEFHFQVYTTQTIFSKTGIHYNEVYSNISFFLKDHATSKKSFLKFHLDKINACSLVYFNTLDSDYEFFLANKLLPPKCLRIHNSNTFLKEKLTYQFVFDPLVLYKNLSYLIRKVLWKEELRKRKLFLQQVDYFVFSSESTVRHALDNYPKIVNKIYPQSLPIVYSANYATPVSTNKVTVIAIIGTVDRRRRNYQMVINSLERIKQEGHSPLRIYLLGRPIGKNGRSIVNKLQKLASHDLEVETFDTFVEESVFTKILDSVDFILIPLHLSPRFTLFNEQYGLTKVSGNVNDAIFYNKKAILNKQYSIDPAISSSFLTFENEKDLALLFRDLENFKSLTPDYSGFEKTNVVEVYRTAFHKMISSTC